MVNGGDGNDIFVNGPAIQPSPDAIEEFRVLTNTFDAEYGRNSGSVVNVVTKSGTNNIHGDVFEFFRNKVLNTRGYFDPAKRDYKQNQFGATLGGPLRKDKTFIFGSYEGDRLRQGISSGLVTLPTAPEAKGDFSAGAPFTGMLHDASFANVLASRTGCAAALTPVGQTALSQAQMGTPQPYTAVFVNNMIPTQCFDPTALDLYNKYVAPFGTGTISAIPVKRLRDDQFTTRFDHTLTATQHLSVYYYFDDDAHQDPFSRFQQSGANLPGFGANFATRVQQWNVSHTWTIGSSAVNEFRFNYFREGQGTLNHPQTFNDVHQSCSAAIPPAECFQDLNNLQTPNSAGLGITTNIPGREGVPFVSVGGGFVIGNNFNGELPQVGNTFQWMDNYSKIVGKHSLKFGADVRRQRFDQFLYFEINGAYTLLTKPNLCVGTAQPPGCTLPNTNDIGYGLMPNKSPDAYPDYFIGAVNTYAQGAAQGEDLRNSGFYLFAQDSWKMTNSLTLNYGLRWELNTPYYDLGNRLQTFRPGQISKQYTCFLDPSIPTSQTLLTAGYNQNCNVTTVNPADPNFNTSSAVFPVGLVFPGDPGVPRGLTSTYYKSFAPRVGLAWAPGWTEGWLRKLTGGPGKTSVRMGWGIFYNPIEQLVLEQFSAEPPFGGSSSLSNTLFNLPFENQAGFAAPNPFRGIINQTPKTPCAISGGPVGCVDWSKFRPLLLFGEFQPHLRAQYSEQYNFTIERELAKDLIMHIGYVGTQAHHLLASHDLNPGNAQACLDLQAIASANPQNLILNGVAPGTCGPFGADNQFFIPPTAVIPAQGLHLPYNAGPEGTFIPGNTLVSTVALNGINLVGLRPFSSPLCDPLTNVGCPSVDGNPVFGSIFAEDTVANSNYNSLQAEVEKHYSHGLQFSASYTYSKAIDQGASFESELNPFNFRRSRGLSLVDARHRFVFSPYWEFPIPKYSGFKGKLVDGWAVSAIVTYQSGFPIRFFDANDTELNSSFFFEPGNTPQINGKVKFLNPKTNGNQYISTANITDPPAGQFGNSPHALCCGPAISNSDISIQKRTPISERINTEFRADIFNAFNHTQFANPDGNFSDQTFGQVQNTREDPRVIQFGLKILF